MEQNREQATPPLPPAPPLALAYRPPEADLQPAETEGYGWPFPSYISVLMIVFIVSIAAAGVLAGLVLFATALLGG